jgi:signal transduction histidine kinase/CheY-like chemotaxis protein
VSKVVKTSISRPVREAIAERIIRWTLPPMALAAISSILFLAWSGTRVTSFVITGGWLLTTLVSAYFAWRARPIPSAAALCVGLALVTGSSAVMSSVHSLGFVGNAVVMALVVPLFGTRWGWAVAAWTMLTGGAWLALKAHGIDLQFQRAGDIQAYVFTSMVVLLMLAVAALPARLLWQALQSSELRLQALEAARQDEQRAATALHQANEQLAQTRRLDALGKLAGGVAHDFNNMLGAIVGATELIALRTQRHRTAELDEHLALLRASTARAAELTRKLLAFGRKSHFNTERYNVSDLVATVTTLTRSGLGRGIAIATQLPEEPLPVWGDPSELEHALLNLVLNARDALGDGGKITITARLITLEPVWCQASGFDIKPGPTVQLSVQDNGAGMTPEVRARAFEPFFTTKAAERGTGLGLSAVHGTVISHKGAIEVDSEPGVGTVFNVYLPVHIERQSQRPEPASAHDERDRRSETHAKGNTVVVVDDNALNLRAVCGLVRQLGYECEALHSGSAALQWLAENDHAVAVISDVMMPDMDGAALTVALTERHPEIPVILMSGFAPEGVLASLQATRAIRVLRKPFGCDELEEALDGAAGQQRRSA